MTSIQPLVTAALGNLFNKSRRCLRPLALTVLALGGGIAAKGQTTATFTAAGNGTWTVPSGVTSVQVEAWGGGGGGGGVSGAYEGAGGGASGSYVEYTVSVTPNATYQYTIGAGGTAGPGSAGSGGTGGSTYFGNSQAGNSSDAVILAVGGPGAACETTSGTGGSHYVVSAGATGTASGDKPTSGATITAGGNGGTGPGNNAGSGAGGNSPVFTPSTGGAALTSKGTGMAGGAPGGGGGGGDIGSTTGTNVGGAGGAGGIRLTYTQTSPVLAVSGTPSALSAYVGTASGYTSFTVSGNNLTANVTVTAPGGLQVSTTSGSGYGTSVTLPESGGTLAATPVYVEVAPSASAGAFSSNVAVTSTGATSVSQAITGFVVTAATAGNLEVEQLPTNGTSSTIDIAEIRPSTGTQTTAVNTYYVNSTDALALRQSNAGSTGRLAMSNDGTLLAFTGFEDPTGVTDETSITARAAASLSQTYQFALPASYTDSAGSGDQTRGATFNNGTWYMSDKNGLWLNGATSAANTTNIRPVKSFGGTVYALSANATSWAVATVSANGVTETGLSGVGADANAADFYMISSGVNGSAYDILYVLDSTTINKFSLVGTTWVQNGSATAIGVSGDGFCAAGNGTGANLYFSTGAGNTVVKVTDTAGYNAAPAINTANNIVLYTPSTSASTFLKGVAFAPLATAFPDLTVAVSASSNANTSFAYTVTLGNSGAASASGVTAQFTLPTGLNYVSGTDNGSAGFTVSNSSGVVSITGGTLAAGATETVTVNVTVASGSTFTVDAGTSASTPGDGFAVINTSATTSSPIAESNSSNNCDNVAVTTTIAPPVITATGTLTALSTSYGVASASTSFTASGANLQGNLTVTAPSGFEISTTAGSGYAGSLTLVPTAGSVPATTVYVRLAATDASGNYSGNVSLSSPNATTVTEAIPSSTVSPSAYLTALALNTGGLTTPFSATATSYSQYVNASTTSVTLTPSAESGATVTVNGQPASTPVSLNVGTNTITVVVTNAGLTETYTVTIVRAGALTTGDLVVTTYGNLQVAQAHPDGLATAITLSEFAPAIVANSAPVMASTIPTAVSGNNVGMVGEYGSSSEGTIQQTPDGLYLTVGGYSAVPSFAYTGTGTALLPGSTALAQSPCATVPRVGALIDLNTNANTSSVFNDIYNTNNTRGIFSPDDINMYLSGQGAGASDEGGIYYAPVGDNTTNGGAAPTPIYNVVSTRNVTEFNGNFYYSCDQNSSSKGTQTGIFEYTGAPTGTQTSAGTVIVPANNGVSGAGAVNYSPEGFWFANATTLYVADTGDPKAGEGTSALSDGGIQKWVYNGSAWVLQYTLTSPNFVPSSSTGTATSGESGLEALTGTVTNGVAYLYGCSYTLTDAGANGLYGVTDTLTATSSTATLTEIAAAPGQQAAGSTNPDFNFKGVSFAPTGLPVNPVAASNVTAGGATLNGTINPEGTDTSAYFEYGTTTSYGTSTAAQDLGSGDSALAVTASLTGLQPNTTYYYELVTVSNGLTSTYAGQSFTTSATDVSASDTPTMPPAGLVLLAMALMGVAYQTTRRREA